MSKLEKNRAQEALLVQIGTAVAQSGFRRSKQSFHKRTPIGRQTFHVAFVPHATDFDVLADVAVRVDEIEVLVNADNKLLTTAEKRETATIGAEIGFLTTGEQLRWTVASAEDVPAVTEQVLRVFRDVALPYFERFAEWGAVLDILRADESEASIHCPFFGARALRAFAAAVGVGDKAAAREVAVSFGSRLKTSKDPSLRAFESLVERHLL